MDVRKHHYLLVEIADFAGLTYEITTLITVWLQVRVLPGPPVFSSIYRCLLCDRELPPRQLWQRVPVPARSAGNTILDGRDVKRSVCFLSQNRKTQRTEMSGWRRLEGYELRTRTDYSQRPSLIQGCMSDIAEAPDDDG
jgi:hypothetical protein